MKLNTQYALAAISSAVLLSVPFLVPRCGFISLIAFIPLLWAERQASGRFFRWHYLCFLLFNLFTTFWVCNATVGGGLFASFANALQMSLVFALFRLSRKPFKGILPYIFLVVCWIAWERAYFSSQISWPWLTLGNAFATSIKCIQWYEFTGTLGGSLWIWAVNLTLFAFAVSLKEGFWKSFNNKAKTALCIWTLLVVSGPFVLSLVIWNNYQEKENPLEVLVLQPNIDPYHKFQALSQAQQNAILEDQIVRSMKGRENDTIMILAPETFTSDIVVNDIGAGKTVRRFRSLLRNYPCSQMLMGASTFEYFLSEKAPSRTARSLRDGRWVESHNSAVLVDSTEKSQIYHKRKLVPGVEMTPYPALFTKVDDLLGGVMGRCTGQKEASVFTLSDGTKVGSVICYESVYGEHCAEYVRKGADVLAIMTNDAWWGNTPGYRQHLSYASLRAIETRRSIARSANTGISAIINQRGEILYRTHWWEKEQFISSINRNDEITAFVRFSDVTGRLCTFLFLLLLCAGAVRMIVSR